MTAEDAGAGVQAGTLVLTVRPEGAAPVPLPLHEAEPLIGDWSGQPAVEAGVPVSLEVSGLPPRAAVTVRILKTVESTLSQIRRRRARGTSGLWPSSP